MKKCPYNRKPCMEHDCMFWEQFRGMNPMTGQEEDRFDCSKKMDTLLLVQVAKELKGVCAATESTRNEFVSAVHAEASKVAIGG